MVDHCRAIEAVLERGRIGETYHVGSGVEASIEEIADAVLDALGQARVAQGDRPRPARPRPALPARLHQDPDRARLGADHRLRGGTGRDGAVVRGEPRLVGTAAGPGPGGRDLVGRAAPPTHLSPA